MLLFLLSGWASGQGLDGVWRSRGYGIVYRIQGPALQEFQITEQTCVRGLTGRRVGDRVFAAKGQGKLSLRIDGDAAFLHLEEAVSDIQFDREARIPAVCDVPTADTPMGNFEVFTRTWAEHYISFEPRHVDWDKVVAEARAKIGVGTTPGQLFDALEGMIAPLRDGHTFIGAPKLRRGTKAYWRRGSDRLMLGWPAGQFAGPGRQALFQLTDRGYLQRQARKFCRGQLQFGHVDDATGYLRILGFGGYARHDDLKALEAALDEIFAEGKLRALVIDMRLSFGGSDELGLAIARRLAGSEYLAYTVEARGAGGGIPVMVRPNGRPKFRGPVVVLTGPITMSAAETFVMSLMGRTPRVTRTGESTQGLFCDVLEGRLPNGWRFGLPNAVYRSAGGEAFDARGIPPDFEAPVYADGDVAAGIDPGMAKALDVLRGRLVVPILPTAADIGRPPSGSR